MDAFSQDLNHVYPGLSALSLLCIRNELAQALPEVWKDQFDSDDEAARELGVNLAQFEQLAGAIQLSLKSKRDSLRLQPATDSEDAVWLDVFEADFSLLTATRPRAVAQRYRDALTDQPVSVFGSVYERIDIFRQLEVRKEFSAAALATVDELSAGQAALVKPAERPQRVLLFTGHMVDELGRAAPRFPPTKAAEDKAANQCRADRHQV